MSAPPLVIAHRGVHGAGLTENTLPAFQAAIDAGADMIELDVRRTGAGELVVLHDHAIGRVVLDSCSLDEFEAQTGFRPPLLSEVLDWARGRIGFDVELKEDGYVEQVAPLLLDFAAGGSDLIVTSFIDPVLAALHERAPGLELGLLLAWTSERFEQRAYACGAKTVLPEMRLVDDALLAGAAKAGLDLIAWDFMPAEDRQLLADARARGVITDDVPSTLAALAAR
jgi:glycerophosphoryl diester phosphodiesterase